MAALVSLGLVRQLWRYYQAGIVNTLFGAAMYTLLVATGLNMYLAQFLAHVLGVAFNYVTYSRHVFSDAGASKFRFLLSYGFSYLLSAAVLAAAAMFVRSPYVAGLIAIAIVSLLNFFVLKQLVFVRKAAE